MLELQIMILSIVVGGIIIFGAYLLSKDKATSSSNYKEMEKDEFLFVPGTQIKMKMNESTGELEVVEKPITFREKELYFSNEDKEIDSILTYLYCNFTSIEEVNDDFINLVASFFKQRNFSKWSYSYLFLMENRHFIFIVNLIANTYLDDLPDNAYSNSFLFIIRLKENLGHYRLVVSDFTNEIINTIFNNEPFDLKNYNVAEIEITHNPSYLKKVFLELDNETNLDIELKENLLLIRTLNRISFQDVKRIEKLIFIIENLD